MSLDHFIIWVFCIVDNSFNHIAPNCRLRTRGFAPSLTDSEVITMEIIGEFLGIDTDKGIWSYFNRHWHPWFPKLGSRSAFAKQASNLWNLKQKIHIEIAKSLEALRDPIHLTDGFPVPVCKFKRANFSKCFKGDAAYGHCASKGETYYGFHGHLIVDFNGVIAGYTLAAANTDERDTLWEVVENIQGLVVGDKGFIRPYLKSELAQQGIQLETPLRSNMKDERDPAFVRSLMSTRRLVETVIGQLTERFNIEKVWARDLWHLTNRFVRKILAHTVCVFVNCQLGRKPLQFEGLVQE